MSLFGRSEFSFDESSWITNLNLNSRLLSSILYTCCFRGRKLWLDEDADGNSAVEGDGNSDEGGPCGDWILGGIGGGDRDDAGPCDDDPCDDPCDDEAGSSDEVADSVGGDDGDGWKDGDCGDGDFSNCRSDWSGWLLCEIEGRRPRSSGDLCEIEPDSETNFRIFLLMEYNDLSNSEILKN